MKAPQVALKDRRSPPAAEFVVDDWLWVKPFTLKAGQVIEQHRHLHSHVLLVATGKVRIWVEDQDMGEYVGPVPVEIVALSMHKVLAVTDAVVCCIHNLRGEGYPATIEEDGG